MQQATINEPEHCAADTHKQRANDLNDDDDACEKLATFAGGGCAAQSAAAPNES